MNHKTSRKNARELIALAAQLWPKTFVVHEAKRRPLQIGIDKALIATGALTPTEASALLSVYCSNVVYLARSTEGAARVDLNGDAAGYVTATEAAGCAERLRTRRVPQAANVNGKTPPTASSSSPSPMPANPAAPKRLGLSDLREAWRQRQAQQRDAGVRS